MTNTTKKRGDRIAEDQAMITGTEKYLGNLATLPVGGTNMTPADIVKVFQSRVDAGKAVQTAEAARTTAVKADLDTRTRTAATVRAFRRMVLGMFQETPDTLAVFDIPAPKPRKVKVATKAAAAAKNKATRAARGTVGPKKKLAIKGTVPAGNSGAPAPATPATGGAPAGVGATAAPGATPAKPNA
jgi:hypothetical protein